MMRQQLIEKTERILERSGYDYCSFNGCFDIAGRKEEMLLIKVLVNVDAFSAEQSESLSSISVSIGASPLIIGLQTRYESLKNGIIYERFDMPAVTPETFEGILFSDFPLVRSRRGGLFSKINPSELKKARQEKGLTQEELAKKLGVTKKNIYEHEKNAMLASYGTANKLEKALGMHAEPIRLSDFFLEEKKPKPETAFEKSISVKMKKLGFEVNTIRKSRFNLIAKESVLIFSDAEESEKSAIRNAPYIKDFAELTGKKALAITKRKIEAGIPSIDEKEMGEIGSAKELIRVVKKG